MTSPSRRPPEASGPSAGADGSGAWRPSLGLLLLALCALAAGLAWWASSPSPAALPSQPLAVQASPPADGPQQAVASASPAPPPSEATALVATSAPALPPAPPQIPRLRDPGGDQTPDLADYVNAGEQPTMAEVIDRLHRAGIRTGLGAFSPPGTRPPLIGLAVPEDFVLPPGYVRHHQATDDGQRIEAVLMFAPDLQLYDAANRPLAMPPDRVVPPELAPPGLPIRRIVVPAPVQSPRTGG